MSDTNTRTAYLELFIVEDSENDGPPNCYFTCNICSRNVDDQPCPDHAPRDIPGLQLVECDATPRHPRTWMLASEGYPPTCGDCAFTAMREAHDGCEHSHHGRWRRWRVIHRIAGRAYWLGIIGGFAVSFDSHCHGCVSNFGWRYRRPYVLGLMVWQWRCLRRGHWPREIPGAGICAKCYPCPECGSATSCFGGGCENRGPTP